MLLVLNAGPGGKPPGPFCLRHETQVPGATNRPIWGTWCAISRLLASVVHSNVNDKAGHQYASLAFVALAYRMLRLAPKGRRPAICRCPDYLDFRAILVSSLGNFPDKRANAKIVDGWVNMRTSLLTCSELIGIFEEFERTGWVQSNAGRLEGTTRVSGHDSN